MAHLLIDENGPCDGAKPSVVGKAWAEAMGFRPHANRAIALGKALLPLFSSEMGLRG